ncbi:MAG: DegV family EDD domain-containing protein [Candidatus Heimdallarchaeota archaeon]|nr:DegV family EDD domain-containing protein [Candidatus Heimdallarchaeota archaeon]
MPKVKIITDSTSDLNPKLATKYNIEVIPLNIFFDEKRYKDRKDISPEKFYEMLADRNNPWPTTSQPSAKEFMELYNQFFAEGYETIISIHITPNMSGTLNSVNLAKKQMPDKDIIAIDSNTASLPLGLIALEAGKMAFNGATKEEIVTRVDQELIPNAQIIGVIDTLENLHRGGRIGRAQKILGTLLKMKPLMQVKDGYVDSFGKARGHDEAFKGLINMAPKIFDNLLVDTFWVGYTDRKGESQKLYDTLKHFSNAPEEISLQQIGATVGTHLGPGTMAYAWIGECNLNWFYQK